jgi:hypothetical protein
MSIFFQPKQKLTLLWRAQRPWLWLWCGVLCVVCGYLLAWWSGFYLDDNLARNGVLPITNARFLSLNINTIVGQLSHQPTLAYLFRVSAALMVLTNAFLASLIAYKIVGDRVAGQITFLLMLAAAVPLFEIVWWWLSTFSYLPGLTFALLAVLSSYQAITASRRFVLWAILSALALMASFSCVEVYTFPALVLVAIGGYIYARRQPTWPQARGVFLRRLFVVLTLLAAAFVLIYMFSFVFLPESVKEVFSNERGGIVTNPTEVVINTQVFLIRSYLLTLDPNWGNALARQAQSLGWDYLSRTPAAAFVFLIALIVIGVNAFTWRQPEASKTPLRLVLLSLVLGFNVALVGLLVPGIFLSKQILEYRMLYSPWLGIAFGLGTAAALLLRLIRRQWLGRLIMLVVGLVYNALLMVGYSQAFLWR